MYKAVGSIGVIGSVVVRWRTSSSNWKFENTMWYYGLRFKALYIDVSCLRVAVQNLITRGLLFAVHQQQLMKHFGIFLWTWYLYFGCADTLLNWMLNIWWWWWWWWWWGWGWRWRLYVILGIWVYNICVYTLCPRCIITRFLPRPNTFPRSFHHSSLWCPGPFWECRMLD